MYRAYAENQNGHKVAESWTMPSYYRAVEQNEMERTLSNLTAGDYTVYVVAENAYGMQSAPVEATVTVDGDGVVKNTFARISAWAQRVKDFFRHLFW